MGYHDANGRYRSVFESAGLLTVAQLKAIQPEAEDNGKIVQISTGNFYVYDADSILTGDDALVIAPTNGPGLYLLAAGYNFDLAVAVAFGKADAAAHLTSPNTAFLAALGRSYWEVTADWTGGTASTIGASLSAAPHSTKGDVIGGSAGDADATLVAAGGKLLGTIGTDVAGGILWKGNVAVRHDRITSAFTAGAGYIHLIGRMLVNPGA